MMSRSNDLTTFSGRNTRVDFYKEIWSLYYSIATKIQKTMFFNFIIKRSNFTKVLSQRGINQSGIKTNRGNFPGINLSQFLGRKLA